jgi:hypothetical protein
VLDDSTLTFLLAGGATRQISRSDLRLLEIRDDYALEGVGIGAALAAVVSVLLVSRVAESYPDTKVHWAHPLILGSICLSGTVGGLLGGTWEEWKPVPLADVDRRSRSRGGCSYGFRWSF